MVTVALLVEARSLGLVPHGLTFHVGSQCGTTSAWRQAIAAAGRIGYPVLVRPSYVLGGRAMEIVYDERSLNDYFERAARVSEDKPVLIDRFLEDAFEADVDAISDGERVVIGGVMQHIEDAGIHSGDSACVLPPYLIDEEHIDEIFAKSAKDIEGSWTTAGLWRSMNSLFDSFWLEGGETPCEVARKPYGRVAIANADAGAYAYTDEAINQAYRAVGEITKS